MGLALRYNLFRTDSAKAVYGAYASLYQERGRPLRDEGGDSLRRLDFHHQHNGWVAVNLDAGWEWKERREIQFLVSRRLCCAGFLVFVYDGDYWGYEFFDNGAALDHFVQESTGEPIGFPNEDCRGNAELIAAGIPFLRKEDISPYLIQTFDWKIPDGTNVPVRPGDEFRRFDECAVLDFLRMLGVAVNLRDDYVCLESPVYKSAYIGRYVA